MALLLATYADPDGTRVRPGVELLCLDTGDGDRQVRRIIKALAAHGLVELVRRGGGRGGRGTAAEYRLTLPSNLLERGLLRDLTPAEGDSPDIQMSAQSPEPATESPDIQMSDGSPPSPVDNSERPDIQVSAQTETPQPNDRTSDAVTERLTGHSEPIDRTSGCPTTSHRPTTEETNDYSPPSATTERVRVGEPLDSSPVGKCEHGFTSGTRPDGTPSCAFCRRAAVVVVDFAARRAVGGG
nr:hypothetical protein [Allokutzneria albata]